MTGTAPIGAVLALLLLLTGCSGAASPAPAPAPPVSYQDRLTGSDRDISAALDSIDRAPDLPTLSRTVLATAGVISASAEQLATGGPTPAAVVQANAGLATDLRQFGYEIAYLSQQINLQVICTGSTAVNAITTAPSMAALRADAAALATPAGDRPGYDWGGWLPAPRDPVDARMPDGRLVTDRRGPGPAGNGVLQIRDDGATDGLLILARGGSTVVSVAVRAGESTRLDGIPDGSYDLYYATGRDWDDVVGGFGRQCEFHRFTEPTAFHTQQVPGGTAYTEQTITLHTAAPDPANDSQAPGTAEVAPDGLPR